MIFSFNDIFSFRLLFQIFLGFLSSNPFVFSIWIVTAGSFAQWMRMRYSHLPRTFREIRRMVLLICVAEKSRFLAIGAQNPVAL